MESSPERPKPPRDRPEQVEERTVDLLRGAGEGDSRALDRLLHRYLPRLRRWAHGRMPAWAREMIDTDDVVQETVIQTLRHVDEFKSDASGAFTAYLRRSLRNRITDEVRRAHRHAVETTSGSGLTSRGPSPLEALVGFEAPEEYERALDALHPEQREALVARLELGWSYQDIAQHLHKPSADAARMVVARALVRMARIMGHAS